MPDWTLVQTDGGWRAADGERRSGLYLTWQAAARAVGLDAGPDTPHAVAIADAVNAQLGYTPKTIAMKARPSAPKKGRR
jgi:hypothetical protein